MRARPRRFSRCVSKARKAKSGKLLAIFGERSGFFVFSSGGNCVQNKTSPKPLSPIFSRYGGRSGPAVRAWVCATRTNPPSVGQFASFALNVVDGWSRANFTSVDHLGQKETENSKIFTTSMGHSNNIREIRNTRELCR